MRGLPQVRQPGLFRLQRNEWAINLPWPRLMIVRYVACLLLRRICSKNFTGDAPMRMLRICSWLICASLAACTTPPEIKQALVAKDQAYAENEQLMQQYRELVSNITTRHQQWYRFVQTRLK